MGALEVLPEDAPPRLCCEVCYSLVSGGESRAAPGESLGRIPCGWDPRGAKVRRFPVSLPALREKGQ